MSSVFKSFALAALSFSLTFSAQAEPPAAPTAVDIQKSIRRGDDLLFKTLTEESAAQALAEYEAVISTAPDNYEAHWKASRALCYILDYKTHQLIEERDEYKPYLKDLGSRAEDYAKRANEINPKGPEGLAWYAGSYSYHAASMGIVTAILKGAGSKLKDLANALIETDDAYHGAFGYRIMGRLNLKAPFPVGSKKKAVEYLKKAVEKSPGDLLNHFWLGEAYRLQKEYGGAREQFQYVIDHPPMQIEAHVAEVYKIAAKTRLEETTK